MKSKIQKIIADVVGFEEYSMVKMNMSLYDDLSMDEEEVATVLEALEADLDMELVGVIDEFDTVGELIAAIKELV